MEKNRDNPGRSAEKTRRLLRTIAGLVAALLILGAVRLPSASALGPEAEEKKPAASASEKADELPESFFDDALFVGDSLTGSLQAYTLQAGGLGKAKIVYWNGLACHNIMMHEQKLVFMGKSMTPAEAAQKAEAKKLFLLLAANDVGTEKIEKLRECWDGMLADIRKACPEIEIYIQSGTPFRGDVNYFTKENMDEYNDMLRKLCAESDCVFVDITEGLLTDDGYMNDRFRISAQDNVHMNQDGCAIWVKNLKNPASYVRAAQN